MIPTRSCLHQKYGQIAYLRNFLHFELYPFFFPTFPHFYLSFFKLQYYQTVYIPLRKHAYSNILKILRLNKENFQIKNSDIFSYFFPKYMYRLWELVRTISARRFHKYHNLWLNFSKIRKIYVYPCKPQFYCI